ncbi:MAG: hypothetical protein HQ592_12475 [Planctomycetes bacterium]|nr:hypothetical protein [Planctomycetota bacterium]
MATFASWLILYLSAAGIVCVFVMLGFGDGPFDRPCFFNSLLQKAPRLHDLAARHAQVICKIALVTFLLAAITSSGLLSRKPWSLCMIRGLTFLGLPIFAVYTIAWAARLAGGTGAQFHMGTAGGAACGLIFLMLLASFFFWRSGRIKAQFDRLPPPPQQAFISGVMTLGPGGMPAISMQPAPLYPGQALSPSPPPARPAPQMFDPATW